VGTGTGSLTALMAPRVATVVTAEVDRDLFQLASEELRGFDNVTILRQDVLKNKNRLSPELLATLDRQLADRPDAGFKLVANLPYNVATPILANLLTLKRPPRSMTVTIQKELADRVVASPSTKDYGSLSIWMQSQCRVEIARVMSPAVFWPRPKVTSAIIQVELDESLRSRIPERAFFHQFVRAMFFHRRKFLRSELLSAYKKRLDKPAVDQIMASQGLPPNARAETLDVETMLSLCEAVRGALND